MEELRQVCEECGRHVIVDGFSGEVAGLSAVYKQRLLAATEAALAAEDAQPLDVYRTMRQQCLEQSVPLGFLGGAAAAMYQGLLRMDPNTLVQGQTPLHFLLCQAHPPLLRLGEDAYDDEEDDEWEEVGERAASRSGAAATLIDFLDRGATPDLKNAGGETLLHVLVRSAMGRVIFPTTGLITDFDTGDPHDDRFYHDKRRAAYLQQVGAELVRRGWSMDAGDAKGTTPRQLLQRYKAEVQLEMQEHAENQAEVEEAADLACGFSGWGGPGRRAKRKKPQARPDDRMQVLVRAIDHLLQLRSPPAAAAAAVAAAKSG